MGSLIRLAALAASAIVAISLVLFVVDEAGQSSKGQVEAMDNQFRAPSTTAVNRPAPSATDERVRERIHSKAREAVDDADDILLTPFTPVVSGSGSVWAQRLVPATLALLVYGLGGLLLANMFVPAPRDTRDWREAAG